MLLIVFLTFFVAGRRRHTRWPRDWSSDVCSSDLWQRRLSRAWTSPSNRCATRSRRSSDRASRHRADTFPRSEERRVGKSVDLGGWRISKKKINRNEKSEKKWSDYRLK